MLTLDDQPFSQGHASYFDRDPARTEQTAKIYVQVEPEGLHSVILAQLDTGAPWSILDREIATAIDAFEAAGEVTKVSAKSGTYEGKLVKLRVTLLATAGASLDVDASVSCQVTGLGAPSSATVGFFRVFVLRSILLPTASTSERGSAFV